MASAPTIASKTTGSREETCRPFRESDRTSASAGILGAPREMAVPTRNGPLAASRPAVSDASAGSRRSRNLPICNSSRCRRRHSSIQSGSAKHGDRAEVTHATDRGVRGQVVELRHFPSAGHLNVWRILAERLTHEVSRTSLARRGEPFLPTPSCRSRRPWSAALLAAPAPETRRRS